MRVQLAKHQGKRKLFHATFNHFFIHDEHTKRPYVVFLVTNLRFPQGKMLSGHAWVITKWRAWPEHLGGIKAGAKLEFDAEVVSYLKRQLIRARDYQGQIVTKVNWIKNYGLRDPKIAKLQAGAGQILSNEEIKVLQEDLDFISVTLD
jgi:hypothetical protein